MDYSNYSTVFIGTNLRKFGKAIFLTLKRCLETHQRFSWVVLAYDAQVYIRSEGPGTWLVAAYVFAQRPLPVPRLRLGDV